MKRVLTLGSNAFMKTGIGTVVLFLRRRNDDVARVAGQRAERIAGGAPHTTDMALLERYAVEIIGIDGNEYLDALMQPRKAKSGTFLEHVVAYEKSKTKTSLLKSRDYRKGMDEAQTCSQNESLRQFVCEREIERVECFLLASGGDVLAVNCPENKDGEIRFLGYKFSDRRGHAGLMYMSGESDIHTPLFDPTNPSNPDKISSIIKAGFEQGSMLLSPTGEAAKFCSLMPVSELIDFEQVPFEIAIRTRPPILQTPLTVRSERLSTICEINIGFTPSTRKPKYYEGGNNLWVSIKDMRGHELTDTAKKITDQAVADCTSRKNRLVRKGTTLLSFKLSVGRTARAGRDLYTNEAIAALPPRSNFVHEVDDDYLFALFTLFSSRLMNVQGVGGKKLGTVMNTKMLASLRIPILDAPARAQFVTTFKEKPLAEAARLLAPMLWSSD